MELPQSWVICTLSELLQSLESGSRPKGGVRGISDGIPSLGGEHLTWDGKFDFSSIRYVPKQFAISMNKGHIKTNDILIVKDGATTGKTSFVDHNFPYQNAVVNEHVFICRPADLIDARYLFRFLMSEEGKQRILNNFQGSAQGGINLSFTPNTEIPLAPLNEQRRIVAKLDQLLAKVDACKARLDKIPAILKRFRQSVLAAACSGRLTADWREQNPNLEQVSDIIDRIKQRRLRDAKTDFQKKQILVIYSDNHQQSANDLPESWQFVVLEKLCDSFQYGTSQKSDSTGVIPVLRMGNIQDGKIVWDDLVYTSDDDEIKKYNLKPNTVLFNRTNSPELVGKAALYRGERPAIFAGYLIGINNYPELNSEYLNFCLNTSYAKEYCLQVKTDGVSQSNINAQKLAKFEVPYCTPNEQLEIVRRVEALFKLADQIEKRYQIAKTHVDKLTQSILAKAFRGELVPQDPNDEPAAKLLERIRAERAKQEQIANKRTVTPANAGVSSKRA